MLKLYFAPGSCALASHIALEEAGAAYDAVRLNLANGDQRTPDYLAINPKGRVPALVTEHGVLTETPAILAYIAQTHPAADLLPTDAWNLARAQSFMSYLCSTVHVAHAHKGRGSRWSDDPAVIEGLKVKVTRNMADCFALIERDMFAGPWVMGAAYSVCDAYLFTLASWLKGDGVDIAAYPAIADHFARMTQRPATARAMTAHA